MSGTNPFAKGWAQSIAEEIHKKREETGIEKQIGEFIQNRDMRHKFLIYCTKNYCFGDAIFILMVQQYREASQSKRLKQAELISQWCIQPAINAQAWSMPTDNATTGSWESYATGASGLQPQLEAVAEAVRTKRLKETTFDDVYKRACTVISHDHYAAMTDSTMGKKDKNVPSLLGNIKGSIRSIISFGEQMPSGMRLLIKDKKRELSNAGFSATSMGFY